MKKIKLLLAFYGLITTSSAPCFGRCPRGIVVVPLGWNGAGVAKVVDYLGDRADIVVCSQGGSERGKWVVKRMGDGFNLKLLPSGILRKNTQCYLTTGMEIDPELLFDELDLLSAKGKKPEGRLWISSRAHVVMPYHRKLDTAMAKKWNTGVDVGSRKGIGAAAADRHLRIGIRVTDLLDPKRFKMVLKEDLEYANAVLSEVLDEKPFDFDEVFDQYIHYAKRLKPFVKDDVELEINRMLKQGKAVLFEGTQGAFLDMRMGSYPYVCPTGTTASSICAGAGVGPRSIGHTLGVVQSYNTRLGAGPMPAEIIPKKGTNDKVIEQLCQAQKSYCEKIPGMRYGWVDLVLLREAIAINGIDSLVISKLDELDDLDEIKICYDYVIDGKNYDYLPADINKAKRIEPRFMVLPGWKTPIDKSTKNFSGLPQEARAFVKKLEMLTGIPVSYISIGPRRDEMIEVNDLLPL